MDFVDTIKGWINGYFSLIPYARAKKVWGPMVTDAKKAMPKELKKASYGKGIKDYLISDYFVSIISLVLMLGLFFSGMMGEMYTASYNMFASIFGIGILKNSIFLNM